MHSQWRLERSGKWLVLFFEEATDLTAINIIYTTWSLDASGEARRFKSNPGSGVLHIWRELFFPIFMTFPWKIGLFCRLFKSYSLFHRIRLTFDMQVLSLTAVTSHRLHLFQNVPAFGCCPCCTKQSRTRSREKRISLCQPPRKNELFFIFKKSQKG